MNTHVALHTTYAGGWRPDAMGCWRPDALYTPDAMGGCRPDANAELFLFFHQRVASEAESDAIKKKEMARAAELILYFQENAERRT